ncbi:MAG: CAP domain-containing protein [Rubrobacteraceae bacterium]|uniref:CAP domain-containing protein n=1 Tax=Rubrobacter calidifluminis TaxID=1392640 RepID=UPI00235EC372|nr:CAP domain-containing protein [Rubrobacter calidifluminis]MBX6765135.1 CAP domain-containing protein [Rubrobacteraceae bacterium]
MAGRPALAFGAASVLVLITFTCCGLSAHAKASGSQPAGGYVTRCGGGKIFLKASEMRTFVLHNRIRRRHHLRPFCLNPKLERAARAHSRAMIRRDFFAHGDVGRRLHRFGYRWSRCAENIAWGQKSLGSPHNIMRSWMHSPPHRQNILDSYLHEVGVGTSSGTYKNHHHVTMYTVDFGTRSPRR